MASSTVGIVGNDSGADGKLDTFTDSSGHHRQVTIAGNHGAYSGHTATFRTPGRAGTTGQKIFAIHNSTASAVVVELHKISVDKVETVVKAVTVLPPVVRLWKVTVLPTNGTAGTKVSRDSSATASSSAVTIFQDASADGTSSGTTLTATLPAGTVVAQEFASRLITAAGNEASDKIELINSDLGSVVLNPLQGLVVFLDYVDATSNPITDMWTVTAQWEEYVA